MHESFVQLLFDRQQRHQPVPSNAAFAGWTFELIALLFPERCEQVLPSPEAVAARLHELESRLVQLLTETRACSCCDIPAIGRRFFRDLPGIHQKLIGDVTAILEGDPAAQSEFEIIRAYPGFLSIAIYRIAHALHLLEVPLIPRILTEHAHSLTGIDIHPAAVIGEHFFIDHGTGIVVGETTVIGNHVKLYQGVTLGALSVDKALANQKRHPTVEDHVVIYSGATILGGETVIGHHSIIGGNVWLTRSVPPNSKVYHKPEIQVVAGEALVNE